MHARMCVCACVRAYVLGVGVRVHVRVHVYSRLGQQHYAFGNDTN